MKLKTRWILWGLSLATASRIVVAQPASIVTNGVAGFARVESRQTGIVFTNAVPEARHLTNQLLLDGSGVALGDANGDGRTDIFFAGLNGGSELWRNLGDWRFTNITAAAFGRFPLRDATGCAWADLDGNGTLDLVVNSHGEGTRVFFNDGQGRLRERFAALNPGRGGHSLAIADVDGDGWLDLYVANYRVAALMDRPNARANFAVRNGRTVVTTLDGRPTTSPELTNRFIVNPNGGIEELGEPDVLYQNLGGTNFIAIDWVSGAWNESDGSPLKQPPFDWGMAAQFRDLNGDGRPELYVCNDFASPDRLWLNESTPGRIHFRLAPPTTLRHTSLFSMGVDFADVNRDGRDDFVVLDMLSRDPLRRLTQIDGSASIFIDAADPRTTPQADANTLQIQRADGTFAEVAAFAGLLASDWSWTPAFLDVDLDGWEDLLITAGQERGSRDLDIAAELQAFRRSGPKSDAELFAQRRKFPRLAASLLAFRNNGVATNHQDALTVPRFDDLSQRWGFDFFGVSHGLALGDLDDDGDLDVVVSHLHAAAGLYRNNASAPRVRVRLRGRDSNRAAIGARITVRAAGLPEQSQEIMGGGRYLSGDAAERTFATGSAASVLVEVRWPEGKVTRHDAAPRDTTLLLTPNAGGSVIQVARKPPVSPLFERLPPLPNPRGEPFDDFARQPLLDRKWSTRGPGAAWWKRFGQVALGGTRGGELKLFLSSDERPPVLHTNWSSPRTQLALYPWGGEILVAESIREDGPSSRPAVFSFNPETGALRSLLSGSNSVSCLALIHPEIRQGNRLFIGGGPIPGAAPLADRSHLLRWNGNRWEADPAQPGITNLGLVTAAIWADLDGDGAQDLVVCSDWGPLKLFRSRGNRLEAWDCLVKLRSTPGTEPSSEQTQPVSSLLGFWQCLAAADFDGDGQVDLIAGNWGRNSAYELYRSGRSSPRLALFTGVMSGFSDPGGFLAYYDFAGRMWPAWSLTDVGPALPALAARFATHRTYAEADIPALAAELWPSARRLEVNTLESLVLLNRGDHIVALPLPVAAQLAPAMGVAAGDFDRDGRADLFLAQNFFGWGHHQTRDDAGLGLVLLGRGDGNFRALNAAESGVRLEGEHRTVLAMPTSGPDASGWRVLVTSPTEPHAWFQTRR